MNNNFTHIYIIPISLFAAAILFVLLAMRFPRKKVVLSFLTAFSSVIGMIFAFVFGATMEELLIPFLTLSLFNLRSRLGKEWKRLDKGGEEK